MLHTGPSLCKAASRLSLKWLGWGGGEALSGLDEGGRHMTLLHMIPHRSGLSRDPLYTSFPYLAQTNTAIHYIGLDILSPSLTQFREIGTAYSEFTIIAAIGLQKPYAKPKSGQILYFYDVY